MQGQWNSDLNERGRKQAETTGRLLSKFDINLMFASPLERTTQSAEIINLYLNLPICYDNRLIEWDCGDWSGEMYADVAVKWKAEWEALQADRFHYRGPNCENYPDMISRSAPFLEEIQKLPEEHIAIVSHGMIGRVMISQLLGFDETQTLSFHQDNDVVFRISLGKSEPMVENFVADEGPFPGLTFS